MKDQATIMTKGRITVPREVRRALGVRQGDQRAGVFARLFASRTESWVWWRRIIGSRRGATQYTARAKFR